MIIYDSVVKTSTKMELFNHGELWIKKRLLELLSSKVSESIETGTKQSGGREEYMQAKEKTLAA